MPAPNRTNRPNRPLRRHRPPALGLLTAACLLATAAQAQPWTALSAEQQTALAPLAAQWPGMSDEQQRHWLALAQSYRAMSAPEQAALQTRMREWANLTPQQRAQARQSFDEARHVPADEKRAKWEAYQHLPPQERERLAHEPAPTIAAPAGTR